MEFFTLYRLKTWILGFCIIIYLIWVLFMGMFPVLGIIYKLKFSNVNPINFYKQVIGISTDVGIQYNDYMSYYVIITYSFDPNQQCHLNQGSYEYLNEALNEMNNVIIGTNSTLFVNEKNMNCYYNDTIYSYKTHDTAVKGNHIINILFFVWLGFVILFLIIQLILQQKHKYNILNNTVEETTTTNVLHEPVIV